MKAVIYRLPGRRASIVCSALRAGLDRHRIAYTERPAEAFSGTPEADVALFYGLKTPLREAFHVYSGSPDHHSVFVDLGYWNRWGPNGERYAGYHKVVVDTIHPVDYVTRHEEPGDRLDRLDVPFDEKRSDGNHIVLAGMSAKAAWVYGLAPEAYERQAIAMIREAVPDRPIIYWPKDSWRGAMNLPGASLMRCDLRTVLDDAWALVTHHSNSAVHAANRGIPCVTTGDGVGRLFGEKQIDALDDPALPDPATRRRLCQSLAYCQWTPGEMESGECWAHLVSRGLLS